MGVSGTGAPTISPVYAKNRTGKGNRELSVHPPNLAQEALAHVLPASAIQRLAGPSAVMTMFLLSGNAAPSSSQGQVPTPVSPLTYRIAEGSMAYTRNTGRKEEGYEEEIMQLETLADVEGITFSLETISRASSLLKSIRTELAPSHIGRPLISYSAHNEIIFEWWNKDRRLTLYIDDTEITFVESWGSNIVDDMTDGVIATAEDLNDAWRWLHFN